MEDIIPPTRQKTIVRARKLIKKGSFLCVSPQYSSKTLIAGKQFNNTQGKTVMSQTSYVQIGIEDTKTTQKNMGERVVNENNSTLISSLDVNPK